MSKALHFIRDLLLIRRIEFRIAEIPIVAMPALLLFAFGDMINGLADRDLDAKYKPHLSRAVYNLGVPFVTFQVILWAVLALALSVHLAWILHRWQLPGLTAIGLALGAAYSVEPFRLKGRGLAQLACLWLIIFVGPMFMIAMLFGGWPTPELIAFASAYGAVQMGIILVNTAEDYPEDREAGVNTVIVSLGLARGIRLALFLTAAGAFVMLATFLALFQLRGLSLGRTLAILPSAAACYWITSSIQRLSRQVSASPLEEGISRVKAAGRFVPAWVTVIAWTSVIAMAVLFVASAGLF